MGNVVYNFSGQTALVTGASGYIGAAISDIFVRSGANIICVDRPGADYRERFDLSKNERISFLECDFEKADGCDQFWRQVESITNQVDILVNNAAFVGNTDLAGWCVPFEQQSSDTWRRAIEVNLTAPFLLSKGFSSFLKDKPGSIVNIASIYGLVGPDWSLYEGTNMGNPAAYSASKGGLVQLTRWLASSLGPNVRVNAVCPGGIERGQSRDFIDRYLKKVPLRCMATEEDVAEMVAFLSSDASKYVSGAIIPVDGGFTAM